MRRFLVAAAVVLAAADHAPAQVTPPPPAPFTPPPAAPPQLVVARVVGDKLVWETTQHVPVTQKVKVTVLVDGRPVVQEREVVVAQAVKVERQEPVARLRVTDGAGKAVPTDRLAARLGRGAPVVLLAAPLPDEMRRLFRDDTLLIELSPPAPVPVPARP